MTLKTLIKSRDGTMKCECRYDFVILHNSEVQCSSCGQSYGFLSTDKNLKIIEDETDLTDKHVVKIIQSQNDILFQVESMIDNTMITSGDRAIITQIKQGICFLRNLVI